MVRISFSFAELFSFTFEVSLNIVMVVLLFSSGEFVGHGNSFHGAGGRGTRLAQLRHSLRLLLSMCSTGDEVVHLDLHEQGAIPMLIGKMLQILCTIEAD